MNPMSSSTTSTSLLNRVPFASALLRLALLLSWLCIPLGAQPSININEVRQAMRDEIKRSLAELRVESLQKPYYVEYTLSIRQSTTAKATLGSLLDRNSAVIPRLTVGVRVGKPEFDNTNFFDVGLSFFGSSDDEENFRNRRIGVESNYTSLRRDLWLATDACYKQAVELYAKKESAVKNRARVDTTPDFSVLPAVIEIDTQSIKPYDRKRYEETILRVSSVFNKYARINASSVNLEYLPQTIIYVNSEGREYVKTEMQIGIEMVAATQAADGMPLAETYTAYARSVDDLPSADSLMRAAKSMADNLTALLDAPAIEAYSGPVLFEGQAAAEVFAQSFAPYLCVQRQQLTDRGMQESERYTALQNKIGARVMSEFLSVSSDPSQRSIGTSPVFGSTTLDDDGIRPRRLELVDKGYLKTLLTSRIPTKKLKVSNGHQRGGAPMIDVLELVAQKNKQLDHAAMMTKMKAVLKKRDLPYGYVVRKALNLNLLYTTLYMLTQGDYPYSLSETTVGLLDVYRVYADGHEELVRGTQAAGMAPSTFKDILAAGTRAYVYNYLAPAVTSPYVTGGAQYLPCTVVVPDLLFEDVEIRPLEGDFPKPPILSSPMQSKRD